MYIDFFGSTVDSPYKNISEETFKKFSQANKIDDYYEEFIKIHFAPVDTRTENIIRCGLRDKLIS